MSSKLKHNHDVQDEKVFDPGVLLKINETAHPSMVETHLNGAQKYTRRIPCPAS